MNKVSERTFGSRVKLERIKRSWTQEHLADQANLSSRTIQRIETGREPSKEATRAIARAFNIPVEDLVKSLTRQDFGAPWDKKVMTITILGAGILIIVAVLLNDGLSVIPIALLGLCMIFTVRGYSIRNGQLLIHRLGWSNRFSLHEVTSIERNPQAMTGSIRLFGNGGLFGFYGYFRNTILGKYRAFVTNTHNCLVIRFDDHQIVVSPDNPKEMEQAIECLLEIPVGADDD